MNGAVRPLVEADHADWRALWTGYLTFYETAVSEEVYASTWARLMSGAPREYRGLIARAADGRALGLAHRLMHRTLWSIADTCYLQDLFVSPEARGTGLGRALIEAVYADADGDGAESVYWTTATTNATARRLYDRIGRESGFLKYVRGPERGPAAATAATIAPLAPADHADWRALWRAYLDFYQTAVPDAVYAESWARLLSGAPDEFRGLIARAPDGRPLGLAHRVMHRTNWAVADTCYLQDLFVAPEARGTGLGRALIEAVYAAADAEGASGVYWFTHRDNHTAQRLYDRLARRSPFIEYVRR